MNVELGFHQGLGTLICGLGQPVGDNAWVIVLLCIEIMATTR